jgi:DNA polymerase III alpha subunit
MPDIDIDFADRNKILNIIDHVPASMKDSVGNVKKHNTGVYCQNIPFNPLTDTASIEYKEAESRGYFKIDFLNVSLYKDIKDEEHLCRLMNTDPLWDLLCQDEFSDLLFHVNGHGAILREMKPASVEQLAAVLAIIRPAKRHLIGKDWATVLNEVWVKPDNNEYYFKKAHAIAYATAIVVQMNLICESVSYGYS